MEFGILTIVHSEDDDLVTTFIKNVAMLTLREKLWKMSHSLTCLLYTSPSPRD